MKGHSTRVKRPAELPVNFGSIRELLRCDPICEEIVTYLSRHAQAMDTARGIAEWWINREVRSTEEALHKLLRHGVVQSFAVGSTRVYAYAKNPLLRQTLSHYIESLSPSRDGRKR